MSGNEFACSLGSSSMKIAWVWTQKTRWKMRTNNARRYSSPVCTGLYAQIIYMLSQCKDAIDNPAALFARMARITRCDLSVWGRLSWIYSRRVNQSGACSSSDVITNGGRKSEKTMNKLIWLYVGTRSCTILLRTFTKTGIHFATRLELPGRSPSHDKNSLLLCSEFHARMKRVNSMFKRPTTLE